MKGFKAIILFIAAWGTSAVTTGAQEYHAPEDTVKVMGLLREFRNPGGSPSDLAGKIAERLIGTPYAPVTKDDSVSRNEVRMDAMDDMAFLNAVTALSRRATSPGLLRFYDYAASLRDVTFRHGEDKGFPTRMVYAADWVGDNKARGNVKEFTEDYSNLFKTKSLDNVTRHRDEYAALRDSATYEAWRMVEFGFRTHKIPHMRRESTEWKDVSANIKDGDIIMLLTSANDIDVYETGILRHRDDGFHLIHVDEKEGRIVEEQEPIGRYIKRNSKLIYGFRWLRIE